MIARDFDLKEVWKLPLAIFSGSYSVGVPSKRQALFCTKLYQTQAAAGSQYIRGHSKSGFPNHCNGAEGTLNSGDISANTDPFVRQRRDRGKPRYPSHPWNKQGVIQQLRGQNVAIFDPHPTPCVDSFYTLSVDKNRHFMTLSPPLILST